MLGRFIALHRPSPIQRINNLSESDDWNLSRAWLRDAPIDLQGPWLSSRPGATFLFTGAAEGSMARSSRTEMT